MSNVIQEVYDAINTDDNSQSSNAKRLEALYWRSSPDIKNVLDVAFIHLCGWSLVTLIQNAASNDNDES